MGCRISYSYFSNANGKSLGELISEHYGAFRLWYMAEVRRDEGSHHAWTFGTEELKARLPGIEEPAG